LNSGSERDRQQVTSLALAATVGLTYDITDITQLDLAYRFLWVDGVHADLPKTGSSIVIDDTTEHQFRAGLRFNVY
jgi:opacity protein-like surface antigen